MAVSLDSSPIAQAWRELGLTAEEVSNALNVHRSFIYDVAKRIKNPSLETAADLCRVLKKQPHELFPDLFAPMHSTDSVEIGPGRDDPVRATV